MMKNFQTFCKCGITCDIQGKIGSDEQLCPLVVAVISILCYRILSKRYNIGDRISSVEYLLSVSFFTHALSFVFRGHRVRYRVVDLQLPMQSVPITTNVVSSNPAHDKVYSIQHYVITFVSDLRQVAGFLRVLCFSSTNKTDRHHMTEILCCLSFRSINFSFF